MTDLAHFIAGLPKAELMAYLAEHRIPLEISPTSNVCTQSVPSLAEHPLATLVANGVPVSINSDDPPMFSTTLNAEYGVAAALLDLNTDGVADLARAAVNQSFLDAPGKAKLVGEIDDYVVSQGTLKQSPDTTIA